MPRACACEDKATFAPVKPFAWKKCFIFADVNQNVDKYEEND